MSTLRGISRAPSAAEGWAGVDVVSCGLMERRLLWFCAMINSLRLMRWEFRMRFAPEEVGKVVEDFPLDREVGRIDVPFHPVELKVGGSDGKSSLRNGKSFRKAVVCQPDAVEFHAAFGDEFFVFFFFNVFVFPMESHVGVQTAFEGGVSDGKRFFQFRKIESALCSAVQYGIDGIGDGQVHLERIAGNVE